MSEQTRWSQILQPLSSVWNTLSHALGLSRLQALISFPFLGLMLLLLSAGVIILLQQNNHQFQYLEKQVIQQQLSQQADKQAAQLEQQIKQARLAVQRLHSHISQLDKTVPMNEERLTYIKQFMQQNLHQQPHQFSYYYAFEKKTAQQYFNEEAMLGVMYKNHRRLKMPNYNEPNTMRFKLWRDSHYLKNEREAWYHINKTSPDIHVTPIYFDKNYTKAEVFSVTQGIYHKRQFQGMVGVDILIDSFFAQLETHKIAATGGVFLVDYIEGLQLTRSGFSQDGKYGQTRLLAPHERMQYNLYRGDTKQAEHWKEVLTNAANGIPMIGADEQPYLVFTRPLKNQPWTIVTYQALDEAQGSIESHHSLLWGVGLLSLLLLLAWILFRYFTLPLWRLHHGLEKLAENPQLQWGEVLSISDSGSQELQELNHQILYVLNSQTQQIKTHQEKVQKFQSELSESEERETGMASSLAEQTRRLNKVEQENEKFKTFIRKARLNLQQLKVQAQRFKAHAQKSELNAQQATMEAGHANQAKAQFLANMSHELRTPMNAIIGYTEILQEDAEDLGHFDFIPDLQKIHGASYHLLDLINNLFDLSKIESSQMDLYLENFDITPMLQDVANTVQPLVEKQENVLKLELQGALGTMNADMTKVRQNLLNLLSNASKFSKQSVITLFATRETRENIDWIIFKVSDEGIGISPEQMSKLFQAFTRLDEAAPSGGTFGGSGVGLALTKQFCQIMGGDIEVNSELGKGSVFTLSLPADVASILHMY